MKQVLRFNPKSLDDLAATQEPYRVWDAVVPQLFVRVQPSGVKSFNVAWTRLNSKSLGKWPGTTIEGARSRARAALAERDKHGAPIAVIEARKPDSEKPITFGDFVREHYAPWALANQKQGKATLDALRAQFSDLNDKQLVEVCAFDVERFRAARKKAGILPATINRDVDRIRGVLSKAVEWDRLKAHPLKSIKRMKGAEERVRYLTPDEEQRLRAALAKREAKRRKDRASGVAWRAVRGVDGPQSWHPDEYTDHLAPLVLIALNCGLRRGEMLGLKWEDVSLPTRLLTVRAGVAKSSKARHIPLNDEALAVLTRWKGSAARGLVFPSAEGGRMTNVNKSWDALVEAAELEDFKFHDLRHHFASALVQNGVDLYSVMRLLGHSDFKMTQRYAHLAPDHLAAAVAKVGAR